MLLVVEDVAEDVERVVEEVVEDTVEDVVKDTMEEVVEVVADTVEEVVVTVVSDWEVDVGEGEELEVVIAADCTTAIVVLPDEALSFESPG